MYQQNPGQYGEACWPDSYFHDSIWATEKEWPRASLYGGLLCENATQATAASLLRYALRAALKWGLKVVLHVHDELVVECDVHELMDPSTLHEIMNTAPAWAEGLPLDAPVEFMERFGK